MTIKPRVASFFTGIGGLDLGFEWAGFDIVWATDIMGAAVDSYTANFGRTAIQADINELDISSIPDVDVVIGGPPCQSFSLVGQRRADDKRGGLVYRFVEVVKSKAPTAFVMENVPGLAASKVNGVRLTDILAAQFTALGYQVSILHLDASQYLVPQKRKRIVLVGIKSRNAIGAPNPRIFARDCYEIDIDLYDNGAAAALGDLGTPVGKGKKAHYRRSKPSVFAEIMRRIGLTSVSLHETPTMSKKDHQLVSHIPPGGNYRDVPDSAATQRILNFKRTGGRTTTYARLHPDRPSYTVNTQFRRPNVGSNFHYSEPRLITAREAMRLQSLPDHFITPQSSQEERNTLIGNAVPPLLGQAIAWGLLRAMKGLETDDFRLE